MQLLDNTFEVKIRKFKGQSSGQSLGTWSIAGNNMDEWISMLWNKVKGHIRREVLVDVDSESNLVVSWAQELQSQVEDLHKFIDFYDRLSKRSTSLESVDMSKLQSWKRKSMQLFIYPYTHSVSNNATWKAVDIQLLRHTERNRANASSTESLFLLKDQLKSRNSMYFAAEDIYWLEWANFIQASPAETRDYLMQQPPPPNLIRFFQLGSNQPELRLRNVHQSLLVASNVNSNLFSLIPPLQEGLNQIILSAEDLLFHLKSINNQVINLRTVLDTNTGLLSAMETAVQPESNIETNLLFSEITNMQDIDHIE